MAIAVVQTGTGGNAGATTVAATMPAAPSAGNLLVAFVAYRTVTNVVVSATGWTGQTATANGTVGGHRILTRVADGTEGTTLTFDLVASAKAAVVVAELSGASGTLKSVGAGAVNSTAIAAHTGTAITPAAADFLLYFDQNTVSDAATVSSNASAVPTTGWTNNSAAVSTAGSVTTRNRAVLSYITGRSVSTTPSITWSATVTGTKQQLLVQPAFLPNAPTVGAWSTPTPTSLTANWTAPATDSTHDAPTSYSLDYSTSATFASGVTTVNGIIGTSQVVTGLASNTTYYYRVRAVNAGGAGANSASSGAGSTSVAPAPYALAVQGIAGLVAYWQLDETTGTTLADTATGTYPGTLTGAGYTLGAPTALASQATAVAFGGGSAQIGATNAATPIVNGSLSLSVWVKLASSANANHGHVAGFRDASDFYIVQLAGGTTMEVRFRPSNGVQADFTPPLSVGVWHHLVIVWSQPSGVYSLYIDNALYQATSGLTGSITDGGQALKIGGNSSNYLNGNVDEVALYNVALTAAQVNTLYTGVAAGAASATGQGAVTCGTATATGAGTAAPPLLTGSGATQAAAMTATGGGTASPPVFTGLGSTSTAASTASGTGTATPPALTGQGAAQTSSAVASGAGTTAVPSFTGQGAANTATATATGSGTRGLPTLTGQGAGITAPASGSGTGTASAPAFTGSGAASGAKIVATGAGTASVPAFTGAGAVSTTTATAAGSGTATVPAFTGQGAASTAAATAVGVGTATVPVFSGTGAATTGATTASGAGSAAVPVFTGTGATTSASATATGTGTAFAPGLLGIGNVTTASATASGSGTYSVTPRSGTGAVVAATTTASGAGTATPPAFTGAGATQTTATVASGTGTAAAPSFTGSAAITIGTLAASGTGTVTVPGIVGVGTAGSGAATASGAGTFVAHVGLSATGTLTAAPNLSATLDALSVPVGTLGPLVAYQSTVVALAAPTGTVGLMGAATATVSGAANPSAALTTPPLVMVLTGVPGPGAMMSALSGCSGTLSGASNPTVALGAMAGLGATLAAPGGATAQLTHDGGLTAATIPGTAPVATLTRD